MIDAGLSGAHLRRAVLDDDLTAAVVLDDPRGFRSVSDLSSSSGVPTLVGFANPKIATVALDVDDAIGAWIGLLERMFGTVRAAWLSGRRAASTILGGRS